LASVVVLPAPVEPTRRSGPPGEQIGVARLYRRVAYQHLAQPALGRIGIEPARQACSQGAGKRTTESGSEQRLHHGNPRRVAAPRRRPCKAGQLVLQHAAQARQLGQNA
jgi:hypothetical protein